MHVYMHQMINLISPLPRLILEIFFRVYIGSDRHSGAPFHSANRVNKKIQLKVTYLDIFLHLCVNRCVFVVSVSVFSWTLNIWKHRSVYWSLLSSSHSNPLLSQRSPEEFCLLKSGFPNPLR